MQIHVACVRPYNYSIYRFVNAFAFAFCYRVFSRVDSREIYFNEHTDMHDRDRTIYSTTAGNTFERYQNEKNKQIKLLHT